MKKKKISDTMTLYVSDVKKVKYPRGHSKRKRAQKAKDAAVARRAAAAKKEAERAPRIEADLILRRIVEANDRQLMHELRLEGQREAAEYKERQRVKAEEEANEA